MKKFKIGFSKNKHGKIGSLIIQKVLGKKYSHTYFEFDTVSVFDDTTIFHSSMASGVSYWSNYKFEQENTKIVDYEIEIKNEDYRNLRSRLHRHSGTKYAFMQNIGILMVDLLQDLGMNITNPFRSGENCSELVFSALLDIHPDLKKQYNKNNIRPDHIQEILENKKYKKDVK